MEQSETLEQLEQVIEKGKVAYIEVGNALRKIRDGGEDKGGLFDKKQYATFEDYCLKRWGFSRFAGYDYINAATMAQNLKDVESTQHMSFSQAVVLARKVKDADKQRTIAEKVDFLNTTVKKLIEEIAAVVGKSEGKTPSKKTVRGHASRVLHLVTTAKKDVEKAVTGMSKATEVTPTQRERLILALEKAVQEFNTYLEKLKTQEAAGSEAVAKTA